MPQSGGAKFAVTPAQDAVAFLDEARRVYMNATHLNKVQLLTLDMSPQEPFTSGRENEEFVNVNEAQHLSGGGLAAAGADQAAGQEKSLGRGG